MAMATVEVDTVMAVGMAMVATGDMDIGDTAVIIFVHIRMGIGIHIHIGEIAGCRDIGNMVIGFPVIMCLATKKESLVCSCSLLIVPPDSAQEFSLTQGSSMRFPLGLSV